MTIAVYDSASDDLLHLDLSWLNLRIFKLEDPQFHTTIESFSFKNQAHDWTPDNLRTFEEMVNNQSGYHPYLFAMVPIDLMKPVSKGSFSTIEEILLMMFPSDFQLLHLINFQEEEKNKYTVSHWISHQPYSQWWIKGNTAGLEEFLLRIEKAKVKEVNEYFRLAWSRVRKLSYLQLGIRSYVNSFSQRFLDMKYISLCIVLESLTSSQTEVTHRIARTCAVVNSTNAEEGKLISFNTTQFYALRSAIVHGNSHHYLVDYFFHLQALVSRTLMELITLNVENREVLNDLVNQSGFGSVPSWDPDYIKPDFNKPISILMLTKIANYSRLK